MRIRACARILIYRRYRREASASDLYGEVSNSCSTNNECCQGFCRTANKVLEYIAVLNRNNGTKQSMLNVYVDYSFVTIRYQSNNRKDKSHRFGLINLYNNTYRVLSNCAQYNNKHYSCFICIFDEIKNSLAHRKVVLVKISLFRCQTSGLSRHRQGKHLRNTQRRIAPLQSLFVFLETRYVHFHFQ